jgi:hypothetical protein
MFGMSGARAHGFTTNAPPKCFPADQKTSHARVVIVQYLKRFLVRNLGALPVAGLHQAHASLA